MSSGTVEARLEVTRVGAALCAGEMGGRGRGIPELKGQFGAGHRPGEDPEMT